MRMNITGTLTIKVFSNYEDPYYRFVNESTADKTFNVKFRQYPLNGCSDEIIKQVILYPQPMAEFLPDPQVQEFNTVTDISIVTLRNLTENQGIWQYDWEFGDGTSSATPLALLTKATIPGAT